MTAYLPKGRKKAVARFTAMRGVWVLLILGAAFLAILLLFLLGIVRVE
jgi:uncharacterized integral membrane protein